jgi:hypothetical protein
VDVADQYWTYFDTQLISRCNWYLLFTGFWRQPSSIHREKWPYATRNSEKLFLGR